MDSRNVILGSPTSKYAGWGRLEPGQHLVRLHPPPAVVVRHDERPRPPEVLVPVGVVVVPVRVDHEIDGVVGQFGYGRDDLVGQRSEPVVDDEGAVVSDRDGDVPAAPLEQIDGFGNPGGLDLDVVEVLGRAQRGAYQESEDGGRRASHVHSLRLAGWSHSNRRST